MHMKESLNSYIILSKISLLLNMANFSICYLYLESQKVINHKLPYCRLSINLQMPVYPLFHLVLNM